MLIIMDKSWYLLKDRQRVGPYSLKELNDQAAEGLIKSDDLLWDVEAKKKVRADQVEGLSFREKSGTTPADAPELAPGSAEDKVAGVPPPPPEPEEDLAQKVPSEKALKEGESLPAEEPSQGEPQMRSAEEPDSSPRTPDDSEDVPPPLPVEEEPVPPPIPGQEDEQAPPPPPDVVEPPPAVPATKKRGPLPAIIGVLVFLFLAVGSVAALFVIGQSSNEPVDSRSGEEALPGFVDGQSDDPFDDPFSEGDATPGAGEQGSLAEMAAETDYVDVLSNNSTLLGEAFNRVVELVSEPELNEEWIGALEEEAEGILLLISEARGYEVPDRFIAVHNLYLLALDRYEESVESLIEGVYEKEPEKIDKAEELMVEGTDYINQAVILLNEL